MCAVCASMIPMAGNAAHGLMVMGAVAGSAAIGSIAGFIGRPASGGSETVGTEPGESTAVASTEPTTPAPLVSDEHTAG
jgi:hypothetical protein